MKAKIAEIFKSIQGEGIYQGAAQVFVRLYGCNIQCSFCDTVIESYDEKSVEEVMAEILSCGDVHSVSITGGEPLMQIDFLKELLAALKKENKTIYLETNGILYSELNQVIGMVDIVAMDFKLPSSTSGEDFWDAHRKFLEIASQKEVFVKAVVGKSTQVGDILEAIKIIKEVRPAAQFVLQPENPYENLLTTKLMFYRMLCRIHGVVARVIPQQHKRTGIK